MKDLKTKYLMSAGLVMALVFGGGDASFNSAYAATVSKAPAAATKSAKAKKPKCDIICSDQKCTHPNPAC
jgi:hypothetical protein